MSSSPPSPAANKAASSQQATLDALAVIALEHVRAGLGPTAARLAAALADVDSGGAAESPDTRTIYQRVKSARLLRENSYAFVHLASEAIEAALRAELAQLNPLAPRGAPDALGLVPLDEIDGKLAFAALARPFDIQHAEALAALAVRLGLLLGRGVLRADANPFRPAVFLQALDAAWRAFEPDELAHGLVQPLLRPELMFDLAPLLDALGAELRRDRLPGRDPAWHIQKSGNDAARAARASHRAALAEQLRKLFGDDGGDDGVPLIPVLPDLPGGKGGWRPSAAAGFDAAPADVAGAPSAPAAAQSGVGAVPAGVAATPTGLAAAQVGLAPVQAGPGAWTGAMTAGFAPAAASSVAWPAAGFALPAAGGASPGQGAGQGTGAGAVASLLDLLARIDVRLPAAPADAAPASAAMPAAPAVPGTPGAADIPGANVFYLPRFKRSLPAGSLARADERTLDLLARVFETVLLDDSIPPQARELLQLLQVPVLKAALLDRNFFYEDAHPARRLVDLLSRMGWEQRQDDADPVFQAMRRSVSAVGEAHATPDAAGTAAAFSAAVADLEAALAADRQQEDSALREAIAAPVASALRQEQMDQAGRAARDAVALRLDGGVIDIVGGFLEQRWTTVLTFAYSIEDERPGAVGNATRAMDDLIWSVKPKPTQEQRRSLVLRLPRLLATLNKWLDAIQWQDEARRVFFADLADCHASIVRAPVELSPERQLELAVEAAQQDALRRVELEQAASRQAAVRAAAEAEAFSPLDGLERGNWLGFRAQEGERRVRLAWVSPLRTLFIFSGADRREAFSMPAERLAQALHAGQARVLAIDGLVGQVLLEAMREGAVNDAAHAHGKSC